MSESGEAQTYETYHRGRLRALPEDVTNWLRDWLGSGERVVSFVFSDIETDGRFGERWAFLTNERLLVLSPNGKPGRSDLQLEIPLIEVEEGYIREYVGSGDIVVACADKGHVLVHFSLGSHEEANVFCYYLKEFVKARKEGREPDPAALHPPRRGTHRCPKCGRTLRAAGDVCNNCLDRRKVLFRLLSYLYPYRWFTSLGVGLTLLLTGIDLAPPYMTKILLDDVIIGQNLPLLKIVVIFLVSIYVGRAIVAIVRSYVMQWLGNKVLYDLRVRVYDHLQMLPLNYYNQRQTGQIMSRVTSDLSRLQFFIAEGLQEILVNVITMFLIAIILLAMNWKLFFLALAPIPLIAVSIWFFGHRIHLIYHRIWRRMASVSSILTDTIPGIRVVKSFAQEKRESDRFSDTSLDLFGQEMRAARWSSGFFPLIALMTGMGAVLIFSVGGYMVLAGETTPGILIAFTGYLWRFYLPVQQFGQFNHRLQMCATSAERVFEVLDSDIEPLQRKDGVTLSPLKGRVEFEGVRFNYAPGKAALEEVSFAIEPGEMIGLVGPSGAGKSTLVHLITRFYDVDGGQIYIDGHRIEDLNLRSFREQIGVVLQEPYLFHGPIWQNIAYAQMNATADEIIRAARAANAHDFIMDQPDGYDTVIGERGQTLSGGERQRISIARAILRDPRILILDEATASVDTETEVEIQTALERLVENRTTFAIAHRLSTLRKANRLLVLEQGKLVEIGSHEELIASGGLYNRLVGMQSQLSKMRVF
ncbi:ABC transporter ATP-binding protein [bacterium]|nr:ABC transporter ATP-binding protein [bacterium]